MPSPRLIPCLLGVVLFLASSHVTIAAITKADREVQTLANFPALQKLAARNDGKLRAYLSRVSNSYRKAGYAQFARELQQSTPLVLLFGQPEHADGTALKKARSALRDLTQSLSKNRFLALPDSKGKTLPDYYGIGALFVKSAGVALKNLATHKNVANSLRNNKGSRWLTNIGDNQYTFQSSVGGTMTQVMNFSSTSAGTLSLGGSGSFSFADSSFLSNTLAVNGSFWINSTFDFTLKKLAFPPDLALPEDGTYTLLSTLTEPQTLNAIEFPVGTRIVMVARDFPTPEGAFEIPYLTAAGVEGGIWGTGTLNKTGTGTLNLTGSNSFSGNTTISGGSLMVSNSAVLSGTVTITGSGSLQITAAGVWAIFTPDVAIPTDFSSYYPIFLGEASIINGTEYPAGTRIALASDSSSLPEGAVVLSIPATITAVVPLAD